MSSSSKTAGFSSWETGARYQLLERLGKGSYGEVVKARDQTYNRTVAIKQMKHVFEDSTDAKRAYRELHILRHLKHPSVVALLDVMCSAIDHTYLLLHRQLIEASAAPPPPRHLGNLYLVFEFMDSDLSKIMKSNQYLSDEHIQYLLFQILDGLSFIHQTNVIHRDLKPANVLVSCADCTVKIADFGLSRVVGSDLIVTQYDADANGSCGSGSADAGVPSDDESESLQHHVQLPVTADAVAASASVSEPSVGAPPRLIGRNPVPPVSTHTSSAASNRLEALPPPLPLKRGLTKHVVTRWYRAPEVILLQPYTAAVDIWSVGCIFAELLNLLRDNVTDYRRRRALFPGESCGELSADDLATVQRKRVASGFGSVPNANNSSAGTDEEEEDEHQRLLQESFGNEKSQLNIIFNVIGTPSDRDLRHIDSRTLSFLKTVKPRPPRDLKGMFPAASPLALDLLTRLLRFDPAQRLSAADALSHPYFDLVKSRDYINAYKAKNQHIFDDELIPTEISPSTRVKQQSEIALRPNPMNVDIEKQGESPEFLKRNIVHEVLYYRRRDTVAPPATTEADTVPPSTT